MTKTKSIISTRGTAATTFDATLPKSDLNWEPLEDTVSGTDTAITMPRMKLLYRSDTKAPLGIVGQGYSPSQPREFLKEQFEFAEAIKGKVTRAGFLAERCRAFAFVRMDLPLEIKTSRKVGDPLSVYIYSTDGWDGGTPRKSKMFIERLRCSNGMVSKEIKANMWVSHTANREKIHGDRWKVFMNNMAESVAKLQEEFQKLADTKMTKEQMLDFAMKLIPAEGTKAENRRGEIVKLFTEGVGTEGVSRWDAYNAVTEYTTHHRAYRETDVRSVETNRFLGVLDRNKLAGRALALLLN